LPGQQQMFARLASGSIEAHKMRVNMLSLA